MPTVAPLPADLADQVRRALAEDVGSGDVTARLIPGRALARGRVLCREPAVLCGTAWFDEVFRQLDPAVHIAWQARDGDPVPANAILCTLSGPARALLTGERTALNFLQLLSATATTTARYVAAVSGTGCRILDTRKTIPGLRTAQKYAVLCGGGQNHRIGLFDMVLIKENHIAAAGSIAAAVAAAHSGSPGVPVEVETETLAEFDQALTAGADVIMLDEYPAEALLEAVLRNRRAARPAKLEISGSVSLETLPSLAATGVDYISVGSITKHVRAIDLSMRLDARS
jgi:nicotinate-nucleotide pyrophosphorylase (carboxylating)